MKALPTAPTAQTPLVEAQNWLRGRLEDGVRCPCCTQLAKVYRRGINSGMAHALIVMYRAEGLGWQDKTVTLRGVGAAARDESLLRYWGLLEEHAGVRDDGGRAGWWRVTLHGQNWIYSRVTVLKYARIYDGRCLGLTGPGVTIRDALGVKFDLQKLMAGV